MKWIFFAFVFFFTVLGIAGPQDVPNFHVIEPGLLRSGRPTLQGLKDMRTKLNMKTIVNLENDPQIVQQEKVWATQLGYNFISLPMSAMTVPNDEQVRQIEILLSNVNLRPLVVHCHYGKDRTGLIVGLHRVFDNHWTPQAGYQEMLKYGFHPELMALDHYYRVKTGLH